MNQRALILTTVLLLGTHVAARSQITHATDSGAHGVLVLQTSPPGAEAFLDDRFVGMTPLLDSTLVPGGHRISVYVPSRLTWNAVSAAESISVDPGSRIERSFILPIPVLTGLSSAAWGAVPSDTPVVRSVLRRFPEPASEIPRGLIRRNEGLTTREWWTAGSAGAGVVSGIAAAALKAKANAANDDFLAFGNPGARDRAARLDRQAAIALAVAEVSACLLAYLLLAD